MHLRITTRVVPAVSVLAFTGLSIMGWLGDIPHWLGSAFRVLSVFVPLAWAGSHVVQKN